MTKKQSATYMRAWNKKNRAKVSALQKAYWSKPENKRRKRASERARRHGLSIEQVNDLLAKGCAVCGTMEKLHIDHDHKTDKIRGALCNNHNAALGMVNDNVAVLEALIRYLKEHVNG